MNVDEEIEVEEIIDDEPEEPEIVVEKPETQLDQASWQNVIRLMETQNAVLSQSLEDLRKAVSEMRADKTASQELLAKAARKLEEIEEMKAKRPDPVDTPGGEPAVEETLEEGAEKPERKRSKWSRKK